VGPTWKRGEEGGPSWTAGVEGVGPLARALGWPTKAGGVEPYITQTWSGDRMWSGVCGVELVILEWSAPKQTLNSH